VRRRDNNTIRFARPCGKCCAPSLSSRPRTLLAHAPEEGDDEDGLVEEHTGEDHGDEGALEVADDVGRRAVDVGPPDGGSPSAVGRPLRAGRAIPACQSAPCALQGTYGVVK
jgi:hypothetical protein